MTYDEPESNAIFGFQIRCTAEQQRTILQRFRESEHYQRWHALDSVMRVIHACADDRDVYREQLQDACDTANKLVESEVKLTAELCRIIRDVTGG